MVLPSVWARVVLPALLVTLLTLGLGAGLELGARTYLPLRPVCLEADAARLYRTVPGCSRVVAADGADAVLVEYGAEGFRGAAPDPDRPRPRVMVYGDGLVAAEATPQARTFTARLGARLDAEVLNAGVPGYGPDQAFLRLRDEIDRYTPDLVVFTVFVGDDFGDLVRNRLFVVDERGQIVRNAPEVDPKAAAGLEASARAARAPGLWRAARALSDTLRRAPRGGVGTCDASRAQRAREWRRLRNRDHTRRTLFGDGWDVHVAAEPASPHAQYSLRLMGHVLAEVDGLLAERGIPWLLLVVPDPIDVAHDYDLTFSARGFPDYRRSNLVASVRGLADAQGLRTLDATPALSEAEGARHFLRGGRRVWNARGQDRAAEAVAARIRTEALLPGR